MFLFLRNRCFLKTYSSVISRNIFRSTSLTNSYVLSCDKQKVAMKNKQMWVNRASLQLRELRSHTAADKDDLQKLMAVFPDIVKDLTEDRDICVHPIVSHWFSELLQYNIPNGKKYRAIALMKIYKMMAKPENQTPENIRLAMILGWCMEICTAIVFICDDMMDGSEIRRGVPCWYKKDGVGLLAVNDLPLLTGGIYSLLQKYFHNKPYYLNILELFQDTFLKTAIGQTLDIKCTAKSNKHKLELLTIENFENIAKNKGLFYTIILPIHLGMYLAGCPSQIEQFKPIAFDIIVFLQIENDFHDCFGDPNVTGKMGTDIQEGKCTWLAVKAFQKASSEQRKIMKECYGSSDPQKIAAVKDLYIELGLQEEYADYEADFMSNFRAKVQMTSNEQLRNSLINIFDFIFKG